MRMKLDRRLVIFIVIALAILLFLSLAGPGS